jgi:two-component sensor histidine kinase
MLATVTAIASQTLRTAETMNAARSAIESRLTALGRVDDLLLKTKWKNANLASILRTTIEPFDEAGVGRFFVQTSEIEIAAVAALPLAMTLHELCTNATKYGALSHQDGRVEIRALVDNRAKHFRLRWEEIGGPPVKPPTRSGFGSRLIQQSFDNQLNGSVRLDFNPSGVVCEIDIPLAGITP